MIIWTSNVERDTNPRNLIISFLNMFFWRNSRGKTEEKYYQTILFSISFFVLIYICPINFFFHVFVFAFHRTSVESKFVINEFTDCLQSYSLSLSRFDKKVTLYFVYMNCEWFREKERNEISEKNQRKRQT